MESLADGNSIGDALRSPRLPVPLAARNGNALAQFTSCGSENGYPAIWRDVAWNCPHDPRGPALAQCYDLGLTSARRHHAPEQGEQQEEVPPMVGVDYEPDNHETDECGKHGDKCTLVGGAAQGVLKSEQNGREDHHDIDAAANPARVEQDVEIDVVGVFGVDVRRELQRADAQWIFEDDPECDELAGEAAVVGGIVGLQDLCAQLEKFANFGNLQNGTHDEHECRDDKGQRDCECELLAVGRCRRKDERAVDETGNGRVQPRPTRKAEQDRDCKRCRDASGQHPVQPPPIEREMDRGHQWQDQKGAEDVRVLESAGRAVEAGEQVLGHGMDVQVAGNPGCRGDQAGPEDPVHDEIGVCEWAQRDEGGKDDGHRVEIDGNSTLDRGSCEIERGLRNRNECRRGQQQYSQRAEQETLAPRTQPDDRQCQK